MLGYCFCLCSTTYIPVLVFLSCLLKGTFTHHLYEIKSRALDAGGWGCCSASWWQEMALLLMLPVGELKQREWKVNNIYIWPKFLYKLSCVRICISFFLTRTWYTSLNVFQMREEIAGKPSLTRACKPKHGTVNNNVPPSMKLHFSGKAPDGYLALFKVIFECFQSCSFHWQHSWQILHFCPFCSTPRISPLAVKYKCSWPFHSVMMPA